MAQIITGIGQSKVLNSLDTYNHTTLQATIYTVSVRMTMIPPSGLSVVIQRNGSPIASSASPSAAQSNINLQIQVNCAANDLLSVVLSSGNVADTQFNDLKGILTIDVGSPA